MEFISNLCAALLVICILLIPVALVVFIIQLVLKTKHRLLFGLVTAGLVLSIIPLTLIGAFSDPASRCDHNWTVVDEVAPTCEKSGSVTNRCETCSTTRATKQEKLGHQMELEDVKDPTCTENGYTIKVCSACEKKDETIIASTGHTMNVMKQKEASCTEDGYLVERCGECGLESEADTPAIGHAFKKVETIKATKKAEGKIISRCEHCGEEDVEIIPKKESHSSKEESSSALSREEESSEVSSEEESSDVSSEEEAAYIEGVTFSDIYLEYKSNELRADSLYQFNRYRVTGEVIGLTNDGLFNLTGGAMLTMETRVGNTVVFFFAEFEKEQEEALKGIDVGDTITFHGECISWSKWSECELIP